MNHLFRQLTSTALLSVMVFSPSFSVFAQTKEEMMSEKDIEKELIQVCYDDGSSDYEEDIATVLNHYRDQVIAEWGTQVRIRMEASSGTRRFAMTRRGLGRMGQILDRELKALGTRQVQISEKDLKVALNAFIKLDGEKEDAALNRWEEQDISFEALKGTLRQAEQVLRFYAPASERVAISKAWRMRMDDLMEDVNGQWEKIREGFSEDVDGCVTGEEKDQTNQTDQKEQGMIKDDGSSSMMSEADKKLLVEKYAQIEALRRSAEETTKPETIRSEPPLNSVRASVKAMVVGKSAFAHCGATEYMRIEATILASGAGIVKYQWEPSGMYVGAMNMSYLAPEQIQTLEFTEAGTKTVSMQVPFIAKVGPYQVGARIRVFSATEEVSDYVEGSYAGVKELCLIAQP